MKKLLKANDLIFKIRKNFQKKRFINNYIFVALVANLQRKGYSPNFTS